MARCDQCGNDYDRCFQLTMADGQARRFDSFECAIQACAPACAHCGCKVIGHGVQAGETAPRYGAQGEGPSIYLSDPEGNVVELKGPPAKEPQ